MVSVIIPCFNYGHLISDTINSIINQTYSDWEIIVISDGSTDDTEKVLKTFVEKDSRVKYFYQVNVGLAATRNTGLQNAKGEFVQFLDADDLIQTQKFEEQLQIFQNNPEVDIVYGSVRYFTTNPSDEKEWLFNYWGSNQEWMPGHSGNGLSFLNQALKAGFSHLSSPLFRREIVDKVGMFDNSFSAVADYHFLLRCCIANAFFLYHDTPHTYSLVRWHPDNMSKNIRLMWADELKMRKRLAPLLTSYPEALLQNKYSIRNFELKLEKSWRTFFLSGGKLDFIKYFLRRVGLEKSALKFFYKSNRIDEKAE